jgi:hypothetical protein
MGKQQGRKTLFSRTVMPSTLYDSDLWREYAAQMRALSGAMPDPQAKQRTLAAAAGFDQIAQLAEKLCTPGRRSLMQLLNRPA